MNTNTIKEKNPEPVKEDIMSIEELKEYASNNRKYDVLKK